jgi:hypothetical protein
MTALTVTVALLTASINALAGGLGAWRFHQVSTSRAFWLLLRAGQAAAVALALLVGVLAATGNRPRDDLFYLYALLPLAVGFIGEQLRVASAQTVLDALGLQDARAVGERPEAEQRSIVTAILRREMGVMTLVALVVCFMELRAAGTAGF